MSEQIPLTYIEDIDKAERLAYAEKGRREHPDDPLSFRNTSRGKISPEDEARLQEYLEQLSDNREIAEGSLAETVIGNERMVGYYMELLDQYPYAEHFKVDKSGKKLIPDESGPIDRASIISKARILHRHSVDIATLIDL
jgi:hypothetical protein